MSLSDIEDLVSRIGAAEDAGPDLEEDARFRRLESLFDETPPNWGEAEALAIELLRESQDLRVGVLLAAASLQDSQQGLGGFAASLGVIRAIQERCGDAAHPSIDPEASGAAIQIREMAISELGTKFGDPGDRFEIVARLRKAPIVTGFPVITFRDRMISRDEVPNASLAAELEEVDLEAEIAGAASSDRDRLERLAEDVQRAFDEAEAIERLHDTAAEAHGSTRYVNLKELREQLSQMGRWLSEILASAAAASPSSAVSDTSSGGEVVSAGSAAVAPAASSAPAAGRAAPGQISSRADVMAAIASIQDYYRTHEPSSPVPLLLERAGRFVNMNFVDIVQDIAGESVDNLQIVFGAQDGDED